MTKTYTTQQIADIAKVTPQRINQWRNSRSETGFKLTENTDWQWVKGNIVYFQSAITKIKQHKEKK